LILFEITGLITPLLAYDAASIKSVILPVYHPIKLYALAGFAHISKLRMKCRQYSLSNCAIGPISY
jgi:hypothetical protein